MANASALSSSQQSLIPCAYYDLIRMELGSSSSGGGGGGGQHQQQHRPSTKKLQKAVHLSLCLGEQSFVKFASSTHTVDTLAARRQSSLQG